MAQFNIDMINMTMLKVASRSPLLCFHLEGKTGKYKETVKINMYARSL